MEDFLRSCHNTIKGNDAKQLAAKMGLPHISLLKRANPDDDTNHLTIEHLYGVLLHSGDMSPLHALAAEFGYRLDKAAGQVDGCLREGLLNSTAEMADVITLANRLMKAGRYGSLDARRLDKEIDEAVDALLAMKSVNKAG